MHPTRTAFVMEQTLGHVTHSHNLRGVLGGRGDIAPTWLPISFDVQGAERVIPIVRSNWSVRASWRARRALDAAVAAQPLDALVFHTQVTSLFATSLMRRIPSLISLDATPINYDTVGAAYGHRGAGDGFIDRRKFELNKRALHAASELVAWSEWARRSLIHDYGVPAQRIHVLAPGANPAYFDIGEHRPGAPLRPSGGPLRLLFVGGDFDRKGGRVLLEAMRGLEDRCELHVVTRTAIPTDLPHVHMHVNVGPNSPELFKHFTEADAFVLPSYAECLAVVLMEASAAGLPIITTAVGALAEAVQPDESGLVVSPGDVGALRAAILSLTDDGGRRHQMGRAGHALARRKFDALRNNNALLDLIVGAAHDWANDRRVA